MKTIKFNGKTYSAKELEGGDATKAALGLDGQFVIEGARGASYLFQTRGTWGRAISLSGRVKEGRFEVVA